MRAVHFAIFIIVSLFVLEYAEGNIHRAVHTRRRPKQESGFLTRFYTKLQKSWLAIPASFLVGCTGIFPLLVIPVQSGKSLKEGVTSQRLQILLSFAVGGLLGDVFLHLLPEAWMYLGKDGHNHYGHMKVGLWCLAGLLGFLLLEKGFAEENKEEEEEQHAKDAVQEQIQEPSLSSDCSLAKVSGLTQLVHEKGISMCLSTGGVEKRNIKITEVIDNDPKPEPKNENDDGKPKEKIAVFGYLNLLANCIDNFTHGLAVAGSFVVSNQVGMCTTLAILLHEIPHEIGDFAILLKSGFKRWDAAVGQMITASGGLLGAVFGILAEGAGDTTAWVLPFTSGGFIYIAMGTIVPDLLKEENPRESVKQVLALIAGIGTMWMVSALHH
ncbi:zinc transporter ZIP13-like [Rhopilema esculentum]|uniref:zinc transporter ZIP13-like n=1 Tax=Rhopilema esculentum TaxID=499914 RepID=UPI0031E00694